jgi:hypothetical protein
MSFLLIIVNIGVVVTKVAAGVTQRYWNMSLGGNCCRTDALDAAMAETK